jgi:hypothetical protein
MCASQSIGYLGAARVCIPVRRNSSGGGDSRDTVPNPRPHTCHPPTLVPSAEIKEKAGPKQAAPRLAPIAPAPKPTPPPSPAPVPAPAPTPVVPLAGSVTYEVQNCGSDCDYPCNRDCGQTWEDCYVVQEYSGTYDLKLAEDNEVIHGVLKRHVRRKGEVQPQTKRLRGATRLS